MIAVCGPGDCTAVDRDNARRIGELLADAGVPVVCGGGGGVMGAAAAGVRARGGLVVGVLPNGDRAGASPDLSVALVTGMGEARNAIIVRSADAVIAVGGSWGTLSEIALAKRRGGIPVIVLGGWRVVDESGVAVPGITYVGSPEAAVSLALAGASTRGAGRP